MFVRDFYMRTTLRDVDFSRLNDVEYVRTQLDKRDLFDNNVCHYAALLHGIVYDDVIGLTWSNKYKTTALHYLAWHGDYDILRKVIKNRHEYYVTNVYGDNVFFFLAKSGNYDAIQRAIKDFPDILILRNINNASIFHHLALSGNYADLTAAIRDYNKKYNITSIKDKYGDTIWHYLARSGNWTSLKRAIQDYPKIYQLVNKSNETIYHSLAYSGNYNAVREMINDRPHLLNINNKTGYTIIAICIAKCVDNDIIQCVKDFPHIFGGSQISNNIRNHIIQNMDFEFFQRRDFQDIIFKRYAGEYEMYLLIRARIELLQIKEFADKLKLDYFKELIKENFITVYDLPAHIVEQLYPPTLIEVKLKSLGIDIYETDFGSIDEEFKDYICPVSQALMLDPVIIETGHIYDRKHIEAWFNTRNSNPGSQGNYNTDPRTGVELKSKVMFPCILARNNIIRLLEKYKDELVKSNDKLNPT